jgi:cation diffusion facilitator family transporter
MTDSCCSIELDSENRTQKKVILVVLLINLTFFFVEGIAGFIAESSSLLADAVDMGGDALVYLMSLLAIGKSITHKAKVAIFNSTFELILGSLVLIEVVSKLLRPSEPISSTMFIIGGLALLANLTSGVLLIRYRSKDINMKAVWNCTRNDILNNFLTLAAAGGVYFFNAGWPDVLSGFVIATLIIFFSIKILRESLKILRESRPTIP